MPRAPKVKAAPKKLPWSPAGDADATATMDLLGRMLQIELRQQHPALPAPPPQETIHAPTLMCAIGAITGYAAQCAAAHAIQFDRKPRGPNDLVKVACKDGSALYFGDEINQHLILDPRGTYALAGFLAGAVIQAGHSREELPNMGEILQHVTEVACTLDYDTVRTPPGYEPFWNVSQILRAIWPKARMIFEHKVTPRTISKPIHIQHWPVLGSVIAQQYIGMASAFIPPPVAAHIVLESAIKASKRRLVGPFASSLMAQDDILFPVSRPQ
jgi:hypothetical protein